MASIINALTASGGGVAITGDATGNLALQTAGNTAVTVTTSSDVGIGTTNPAPVTGFTTSRRVLQVTNSGYGQLILGGSSGTMIDHDDDANTTTTIRNRYGASSASALMQLQSGYMTFGTGTSYAESMRITSGGDLLVGTTSSYGKVTVDVGTGQFTTSEQNGTLTVQSTTGGRPLIMVRTTSSGQDTAFRVSANRSGTQDAWTIGCHIARNSDNISINYGTGSTGAGTERFYFTSAGAAYNTTGTWGTISDSRFKENIVDATPKLDKINQLKVRNFNLIDEDLKQIGLIAQEVEEIFPSLVETNELKDGKEQKTVKMSVFVPILIKAIQELKAELDATKAEVAALKGVK